MLGKGENTSGLSIDVLLLAAAHRFVSPPGNCINLVLCPPSSQTQSCNTQSCNVNCVVGSWGNWGSCSKSCGGGTRTRTRSVVTPQSGNGAACPSLSQSQSCNTQCCTVNCAVSGWSNWGSCSVTCGTGTQARDQRRGPSGFFLVWCRVYCFSCWG